MICPHSSSVRTRVRSPAWRPDAQKYDYVMRFLPCGKCGVCRTNMVNSWIPRFLGECKTSEFQIFVTLTYDDQHLRFSENGIASVCKRDCQLFFKSLRSSLGEGSVRYYLCGEYGGRGLRPHYHVLLFGSGLDQGECESAIAKYWPHGHVHCGTVTGGSIRYCANFHINKCATPDGAEPSFTLMSRRPGIGGLYFDAKLSNVSTGRLFHIHEGRPYNFGRYYKQRYTRQTGEVLESSPDFDPILTPLARYKKKYPDSLAEEAAKIHERKKFEYLQRKHNKL